MFCVYYLLHHISPEHFSCLHPINTPIVPKLVFNILPNIIMNQFNIVNRCRITSLVILAAVTPLICAQGTYLYQESYGAAVPPDADNFTQELIRTANQHPNATRSISFKPFESVPKDEDIGSLRDVQWTWREFCCSTSRNTEILILSIRD